MSRFSVIARPSLVLAAYLLAYFAFLLFLPKVLPAAARGGIVEGIVRVLIGPMAIGLALAAVLGLHHRADYASVAAGPFVASAIRLLVDDVPAEWIKQTAVSGLLTVSGIALTSVAGWHLGVLAWRRRDQIREKSV